MLKTEVDTLVKKGIQSTMILKKSRDFLKIRINGNEGLISPTKIVGSRQVGAKIWRGLK